MSVNVFAQIVVGAISLSLGIYMVRLRGMDSVDGAFVVPLVFIISGWSMVVFAMDFNPYVVVAAMLFILSLFTKSSDAFKEMAFIFAVIGGLSFARGTLGDDTKNMTKISMITVATISMGAFWMFDAPLWTAVLSWLLFALVASTPKKSV